jgi:hypothetical protein
VPLNSDSLRIISCTVAVIRTKLSARNSWLTSDPFLCLFTTLSRTALEPTQPLIQRVPGALSLGVKRPGCEADHSPPSSAEVKECVELYLHSPNMPSWRGAQLKHRDYFTFTPFLWIVAALCRSITPTFLYERKSKSKGKFQKKHIYCKYAETKLILLCIVIPHRLQRTGFGVSQFFLIRTEKISWLCL